MLGYEDDAVLGGTFAETQDLARQYAEYVNGGWSGYADAVPVTVVLVVA